MNFKLKKISGDASFREFYRIKKNKLSTIIVYAKKDKFRNLIIYSVINKILNSNNISAPQIIRNYYEDNMIEITDLGDQSFLNYIKTKKKKFKDYKRLIELIIKLQKIKFKKVYYFGKKKIKIKRYSLSSLISETDLFFDWYLKYVYKDKQLNKIKNILKKELIAIYKKIYFKNDYFTHRDFHASNIMLQKNKLALIDNQDAIIGNPLYDVASLIDDVRIKIPKNLQDKMLNYYFQRSNFEESDYSNLKNDFDILSVQRNLRILGIFTRLCKRDNKNIYLKYLPYTWKLIDRRMKNPIFKNLKLLMKKYLPLNKLKKIKTL